MQRVAIAQRSQNDQERSIVEGMRRIMYKAMHLYKAYRTVMWLASVGTAVGLPLIGYALHAFDVLKQKRSMSADDPEAASALNTGTPLSWLSNDSGVLVRIMQWIVVIGVSLLAILLVFQLVAWFFKGAEWSTGDEHPSPVDEEDYGDGYGSESDEDNFPDLEGAHGEDPSKETEGTSPNPSDDGFGGFDSVSMETELPDK